MATGTRPENAGGQQGDAGAGGTGGTGGAGAAGAGAAAGGAAGAGAGSAAGGAAGGTLDKSKLPPVLRNLNEEQIADVWDTVFNAARANARNDQGRDTSGVPSHARPTPAPAPTPPTMEQLNAAYKDYLDPTSDKFNPSAVFQDFIQRNYGGLLGGINKRSVEALYGNFRNQFADFKDYEGDINTVLANREPSSLSENDVLGAYYAAKGYRSTEKERQAANQPRTAAPSPKPEDDVNNQPGNKLTDMEKTIARSLYPNEADPYKKYAEDAGVLTTNELSVPIGGGKKA